jgi:translation elongation factor EF-1alpha
MVKRMNWTGVNLSFVPVNPVTDVNIVTRVKYNTPGAGDEYISSWYDGPALVEVLQQQRRESRLNIDGPARFIIHKVVGVNHLIGEIKSGILKSTDLIGYGDGKQLQIVSMSKNYHNLTRAMPGSTDIELKFANGMTRLIWMKNIKNLALLGPGLKYVKSVRRIQFVSTL